MLGSTCSRRLALFALAAALWHAPVRAQGTSPENIAAARALGIEGVGLANDGKCAEALEKLERAEALYHAPTILGRIGECQVELGRIVLGTENLNRVVREQLAADAPQVFRDAQTRAKEVLDKALPRVAYLVIRVAPATAQASVTVAGAPVPPALLGASRPTDPGTHEVAATAPGFLPAKSTITLGEGQRKEISITLNPAAAAGAAPATGVKAAPLAEPTPPPGAQDAGSKSALPFVVLGVGGLGLGVGAVTGFLAIRAKNSLDCPDRECPPDQHDKLQNARSLALASTIGFGVGVAGVALGTLLLFSGGSSTPAAEKAAHGRTELYLGTRELGLRGSF